MVTAILSCDHSIVRKHLKRTWLDNHRLGIILTAVGTFATIFFGVVTLPYWWHSSDSYNSVIQMDQYGSLTINLERRNALQCVKFERWLEQTRNLKERYFSETPPTKLEYEEYMRDFVDFAENDFTPSQIRTFNQGFGSGAGGEMFNGIDELETENQVQASQLALIEFWLQRFVEYNRKGSEPEPFHGTKLMPGSKSMYAGQEESTFGL